MGGHAAGGRDDASGDFHAVDVLRARLLPDEDDLLTLGDPSNGVVRIEHDPAGGRARTCR